MTEEIFDEQHLTDVEKAAVLLLTLSEENAAKIFHCLDDDEIRGISHKIAYLGKVESDIISQVVFNFIKEMNESMTVVGNLPRLEKFLETAFDKEKADAILEDIKGPAGLSIWDKLANMDVKILVNFLKHEYPQTVALILSKLPSIKASKVLSMFSENFSFEIIKRILGMESINRDVLSKLEKTLKSEFLINFAKGPFADNNQVVADIFNNFDRKNEGKFMQMLETFNHATAVKVKQYMFTFDDILSIGPIDMQILIRNLDKMQLPIALKSASDKMIEHFVNSMSQRASKILLEEIDSVGDVTESEQDNARRKIVVIAKNLLKRGAINIDKEIR